jgi:hypothetical protein
MLSLSLFLTPPFDWQYRRDGVATEVGLQVFSLQNSFDIDSISAFEILVR